MTPNELIYETKIDTTNRLVVATWEADRGGRNGIWGLAEASYYTQAR